MKTEDFSSMVRLDLRKPASFYPDGLCHLLFLITYNIFVSMLRMES